MINDRRKDGRLPLDICAEDVSRRADGLEALDVADPAHEALAWIQTLQTAHERYVRVSFWEAQPCYLELWVEKVDLKTLFGPVCQQWHIPVTNAKGWSDLNARAATMRRFQTAESLGQQNVLLYCSDHDPEGLYIAGTLRRNLGDLGPAVGWSPDHLIIDRFGLTAEFINAHGLTWIDGLQMRDTPSRDSFWVAVPKVCPYSLAS